LLQEAIAIATKSRFEFESTTLYVGYRLSRLGDVVVNVVLSHFFGDAIKDLGAVLDNAVKPGCLSRA
jgi:hypothetical protein